jgi:HEAT repeat protein
MSRPRRRLFGPLLYSTLVVAVLVTVYTTILSVPRMLEPAALTLDQRRVKVKSLIEELRAEDPAARERAAKQLTDVWGWGEPSEMVPGLVRVASDQREDARLEAARGLGQVVRHWLLMNGTQSPTGTVGGLDPAVRDDALRTLRRLLEDSSSLVRAEAAGALGEFGPDPAASVGLTAAAGDDDRAVRLAAARSLLKLNGPEDRAAARALVALVADPDAVPDRAEALQALRTASEAVQDQAVAALTGLLSRAEPAVLPDVIASLTQAGPRARSAVPALEALLDHAEPNLRAAAAMAIVAFESPEDLHDLPAGTFAGMGMATGGGGGMGMVMGGMAPMGASASGGTGGPAAGSHANPKVVAVLARTVADAAISQEIRGSALGMIRAADAPALAKTSAELVRQLADPDPNVRHAAIELLSGIVNVTPVELPGASRPK